MTVHIEHRLDLFLEEEVEDIIELGDALVLSEGKIKDDKIDHTIRNSKIAWIHPGPSTWWLFDRAIMVFKSSLPFNSLQSMQFTIYDSKGSHYDWHRDIGSGDEIMKARVNVGILQLSSPSEYKGGVLQIKYEDQVIDVMKTKGMVTTFPIQLEHRVTPVTSGVRKTLIMWGLT
jgi:PKHD-type hydroxylase|tara:strand:+ start:215 stop:736 length:522 start_codon:yes stop_codon:yes gene_type:complete